MNEFLVSEKDHGQMLEAVIGDFIVIHLEENITTGYHWDVDEVNNSLLKLQESVHTTSPYRGIGGGGVRLLRFQAISTGQGKLQLSLRRPWETMQEGVKRFEIEILVSEEA